MMIARDGWVLRWFMLWLMMMMVYDDHMMMMFVPAVDEIVH